MNYLIWTVSLIGILSTAVVCGTDMFFLTVGRPALRLASPSVGTEVMGFIHLFGDARMPVWGISAILSNFVLALFSGTIVCQSQSIGFKPKRQKREEGSTMLESCRRRGIDR